MGRPTKYKKAFCQEVIDFFDIKAVKDTIKTITTKNGTVIEEEGYLAVQLPTIEGFARKIGVHKDTIYEWAKVHKPFSDALSRARTMQHDIFVQNGLLGLYNPRFAQLFALNCIGWKNEQKIEHSGDLTISVKRKNIDA